MENFDLFKSLSEWINFSKQDDAKKVHKMISIIPTMFKSYSKPLFRGVFLSPDDLNELQKFNKLKITPYTSWTKDKDVALKFINDNQRGRKDKDVPVLIKKSITNTNIVVDIHSLLLFMGEVRLKMLGLESIDLEVSNVERRVLISPITIIPRDITSFL